MSILINAAGSLIKDAINELDPNAITGAASQSGGSGGGGSFANTLLSYIDNVNNLQTTANNSAEAIATGKSSNIHQAMINVEKASDSFEMMMQVRNKIITAYNQIINMQI